jgi:predicted transcriptional regulator
MEASIVPARGPFSPADREIVVSWIKAGVSRNEIARRTGRGPTTVSNIAKKEGLAFIPPEPVVTPRQAGVASELAVRRLVLAVKAADKLNGLLDAIDSPLTIHRVNGRTGQSVRTRLKQPDPAGKRDLAIAAGILFDKITAVLKGDETATEGRAAIITLIENMRVNVAREDAPKVIEGEFTESTNR